ncbi:MAG: cation-transporting P-type ATPase, partial [Pirellulaceae bacterium]
MASRSIDANSPRCLDQFHAMDLDLLLSELGTSTDGLAEATALARSAALQRRWRLFPKLPLACRVFAAQFRSPITLMLVATAVFSISSGRYEDASIILLIVLASALLGFWQEYAASNALTALLATVKSQ